MMSADAMKQAAAQAAVDYVASRLEKQAIIGVGTGSTANFFIDGLVALRDQLEGAVASSEATAERLKKHGIPVLPLNSAGTLAVYVDGADEVTHHLHMIKGGGGALTREKIVAAASREFVCIADASKRVEKLGAFPLPIEVIPMARSYVAREMVRLGGQPVWRQGFVTDNGNVILDVHHLEILNPVALERELNQLAGVVTVGLFAQRPADLLLLATEHGVEHLRAE